MDEAMLGRHLGRYLVIEELGRGAMGVVLRAYDEPDNVLVGSDARVRVTDFGLARSTGERANDRASVTGDPIRDDDARFELTAEGTVLGTPEYMAPEQSMGAELDARADQYAFCVALWRALTTAWPFDGRDQAALVQAKLQGPPAWPCKVAVPRHIVAAIRRGLAPVPADRWPTLAELLTELGRDPGRRRQRMIAVGVVAIAGLGIWGAQRVQRAHAHVGQRQRTDERPAPRRSRPGDHRSSSTTPNLRARARFTR